MGIFVSAETDKVEVFLGLLPEGYLIDVRARVRAGMFPTGPKCHYDL